MRRAVLISLVGALAIGCGVPKRVVEQQQSELDRAKEATAACGEALTVSYSETAAARKEVQVCRDELSAASELTKECVAARRRAEQELAQLTELRGQLEGARTAAEQAQRVMEQEAALRRQLETELEQKTVEIEELQGRLSVRMMDRLLFDSGSADISGGGAAVLAKVGPVLAGGKEMIRVEGHTDDLPVGPGLKSMYFSNWELSAARAASVVRYLQYGQGIDPARLETVGLGGYRPLESNDTSAGRRRNRRVEIVLLPQR